MNLRCRIFHALARLDVRQPYLVLFLAALLSVASILYTKARLEFRTGQEDLVSPDSLDSRNYLAYEHEFPDLDGLVVVVGIGPDPARAKHFADVLAARLVADRTNVKSVFYRVDPSLFSDRAILYLGVDKLRELERRLAAQLDLLRAYAADPTLANFFALVNRATGASTAPRARAAHNAAATRNADGSRSTPVLGRTPALLPGADATATLGVVDAVLKGMLENASAKTYASPWERLSQLARRPEAEPDGYVTSDNGRYLLLDVAQVEDGVNHTEAIQQDLDQVRNDFPDIEAGMTGGPALAHAEQRTTAHDIALASIIAVLSNVLLIVLPFSALVEPAFAVAALLCGVAWSFGFTTLVIGHLNLLSAVFTSVLAGIGINFPIHLMARYDEARSLGAATEEALELALVNTGTGVAASACIMVLAFLTPMFTDFRGIAELGLTSAAGLFMCLLSAVLVFPALVALRDRNRAAKKTFRPRLAGQSSVLEKLFRRPVPILAGSVALALGAVFLAFRVRFNQNLLKLQAENTEAVRFEEKLLQDSGRSSWFAVSIAPTLGEAERRAQAFGKLKEVADSETIATYLPRDQAQKLVVLGQIGAMLDSIRFNPALAPGSPQKLMAELRRLELVTAIADKAEPAAGFGQTVALVDRAIAMLKRKPQALLSYGRLMALDLGHRLDGLRRIAGVGAVTVASLPEVVSGRFIGRSGKYLVQIYSRGDVWRDAALKRFVEALRSVDPTVTGPPVQTYSIAATMRRGYERAAVLALIAVFVFVLADFRSLRDATLATVPLFFGGLWLLEAMGWLGWEFNLANLFAVPIIIGMGVDNGVNMLYRWREERDKSALILTKAVGKSVMVSSLTTIAGFGALIAAEHRGISSLGWVLSLGVGFILVATMVTLPALFEIIGRRLKGWEIAESEEPPRQAAGACK